MNGSLLAQTVISGALVSACILVFLLRFSRRRSRWPQAVAAVIFLDQASRWVVAELMPPGAAHSYLGGRIEVAYHANHLQGFGATSWWLLYVTLVGVIASIRLYQMLLERRYVMSFATELGLGMILGGVATIAMARATNGFVVDFLRFGPSFSYVYNFADLAAIAGAVILLARGISILPSVVGQEMAPARAEEGAE
ncbi:MAG: signal peptidase II [Armatimonadota bacterium]|nr:MAG: signal peptidase II [Armatimonadota bacterium]